MGRPDAQRKLSREPECLFTKIRRLPCVDITLLGGETTTMTERSDAWCEPPVHGMEEQDGRGEDLTILSRWVRRELFVQVKFLYNPEVDLRVEGRLFRMFLRDCNKRLVGLKLNATRSSEYRRLYVESLWIEATRKKHNLVAEGLAARRSSIYSATQNRFTGK